MINLNSSVTHGIREFFNNSRKIMNVSIILMAVISVVYFIYWAMAESSDVVLQYTGQYMTPFAKFLFPNSPDNLMFRDTSFLFMGLILPVFLLYYAFDNLEDVLIKATYHSQDKKAEKAIKQEAQAKLQSYDIIDKYSICLSLEYETKSAVSEQIKTMLNKAIYSKLKKALIATGCNITTSNSDTMIIISADFNSYDIVYSEVIASLAKIKKLVESAYNVTIIPSLTTDAFDGVLALSEIKKRHKKIQSMVLTNRACSTAAFQKKYKHLKRNRYSGIPVEYISSEKNSNESYELNIIYKDLTNTLAGMV